MTKRKPQNRMNKSNWIEYGNEKEKWKEIQGKSKWEISL